MSLSCYRPRPERDAQLRELFPVEIATLRAGGHVTDRRVSICRTDAGEYLVILEWAHEDAVDDAHRDPDVLRGWAPKAELAEYLAPADFPGSDTPFVSYRVVGEVQVVRESAVALRCTDRGASSCSIVRTNSHPQRSRRRCARRVEQ